jgi:hypothetical protein
MQESLMRAVTRPVKLDGLSPVEVAGRLLHLEGLVFFDTAGNFPSGGSRPISVIAARPSRIVKGSIFSPDARESLRAALAAGPKLAGDRGFPLGGLCGWVDYEGDYVIGDFREMLIY